jgi:outer membrane protein TolC
MIKSIPHRGRILGTSLIAYLAGLMLALGSTRAAEQRVLTLRDCIDIALGESPLMEASHFDLLAATEEINAARAMTLPQVVGSATPEIFSGGQTSAFSILTASDTGRTNTVTGGLSIFDARLSYPLFKDGSILGLNVNDAPAIAAKRAQKEALAWITNLKREDVIYRIADVFISTVSAENRTSLVDREVYLLERSVANIQEQEKQGTKLPIDLKITREQLKVARDLAKIIRNQAVAGKHEIARMLALPSASDIHLSSVLPDPPDPPRTDQLLGISLNQHPSLHVQRAIVDKARQDYRLERFRLYPSVSLDGTALGAQDFDGPGNHIYTGAVTVSVPIWDFGAQRATVRSKMATYKAEEARLGAVAEDVTDQIVKTYEQICALDQYILTIQQDVGDADRNFKIAAALQQQGGSQPLTTDELELRLLGKRDELEALQARRLVLYAAMQKASGGLWKWIP